MEENNNVVPIGKITSCSMAGVKEPTFAKTNLLEQCTEESSDKEPAPKVMDANDPETLKFLEEKLAENLSHIGELVATLMTVRGCGSTKTIIKGSTAYGTLHMVLKCNLKPQVDVADLIKDAADSVSEEEE